MRTVIDFCVARRARPYNNVVDTAIAESAGVVLVVAAVTAARLARSVRRKGAINMRNVAQMYVAQYTDLHS